MNRRNFLLFTGLGAIGTSWLVAQRLRNGASHVAQPLHSTLPTNGGRELAVTKHDVGWLQRLGPDGHCVSSETGLIDSFPDAGPARLWQHEIGTGYSSPIVTNDKLILFHGVGDEELVECFDSESGDSRWREWSPGNARRESE